MSNSRKALKLAENDRRWFVPALTEKPWPHEKFQKLNAWLETREALPAIAQWAADYVAGHGAVEPGEIAPLTATKQMTIEEARSDSEHLIHDLARAILNCGERVVLRREVIKLFVENELARRYPGRYGEGGSHKRFLPSDERLKYGLLSEGLETPTQRFKNRFRIVTNFEIDAARLEADHDAVWEGELRAVEKDMGWLLDLMANAEPM
jgi:hypothetical protein